MFKKIVFLLCFLGLLAGSFLGGILCVKTYSDWFEAWDYRKKYLLKHTLEQTKGDILFTMSELNTRGDVMMAQRLAGILQKEGYRISIFFKNDDTMKKNFEDMGITVMQGAVIPENYRYYKYIAQDFDLNIVFGSQNWLNLYEANMVTKTILWVHEVITWINHKDLMARLEQKKSEPQSQPTDDSVLPNWDEVVYGADIVTVSDLAKKVLQPNAAKDIKVIYNGISNEEWEKSILSENTDTYNTLLTNKYKNKERLFTFLNVGVIVGYKGQHLIMDAIEKLPESYRKRAQFYFIGIPYENEYYNRILNRVRADDNIVFTRWVDPKDMGAYYRITDVLLHTSSSDAAPCVVSEAAMYHKPAIITHMVGSSYLIKNNISGFIIYHWDADMLRNKIMWFMDHPEQALIMGDRAYNYFLQTSREDVFGRKWLQKIEEKLKD